MDVTVLDTSFRATTIIDEYESVIWTERYSEYGDSQLVATATTRNLEALKEDYYLAVPTSDNLMIIETIEVETDVENGGSLTVTARSLESLLERRIVWVQTLLSGNLQNGVEKLLNENAINPSDTSRKIPGLEFEQSTDSAITSLTISAQFTGDNLYDAVKAICDSKNIGFRIRFAEPDRLIFSLYAGKDRTYDQNDNPFVIFSPDFDNLVNSNYLESKKLLKTVALVAGEGEGVDRKTATVAIESGAESGFSRRELFVDARDISTQTEEGVDLTDDEYSNQLKQRGSEKLSENITVKSFEGESDTDNTNFIFGEDYYLGDIVQIENEYGMTATSRITEMVFSQDTSGYSAYPTFSTIQ